MRIVALSSFFFLLFSGLAAQIQPPPRVATEREVQLAEFSGVLTDTYADGSPAYWREVTNGKASGKYLEWYPSGVLRYRAEWADGLGNGLWEYFYPDGTLRTTGVYTDDQPTGLHLAYHPNGKLAEETPYLHGKRHGMVRTFSADGTPTSTEKYRNGERVLDEPTLFAPGVVSTNQQQEWSITFEPDGQTAYFSRRPAGQQAQKIFVTRRTENGWTAPVVAPFSTDTDEAPFVSPDGQKFYFASYRPMPNRPRQQAMDMNIWVMDKTASGWSAPRPLPANVNKLMTASSSWPANYETGPTADGDGNVYFYTKSSSNNGTSMYVTRENPDGTFADPLELPAPLNSQGYDLGAVLSPDGNYLLFASSNRPDSFGGEDLYLAKRQDGGWTSPQNLGPVVNSARYDSSPTFSPDGKYLFFGSDRGPARTATGDRVWSIYYLETKYLKVR